MSRLGGSKRDKFEQGVEPMEKTYNLGVFQVDGKSHNITFPNLGRNRILPGSWSIFSKKINHDNQNQESFLYHYILSLGISRIEYGRLGSKYRLCHFIR